MTDIFDDGCGDDSDLDSLLADSLDLKKSQELKKRKEKLGAAEHFQRSGHKAEIKRIQKAEVKIDWRPIAAIAMFYEQVCEHCGARHRHFEGYFQHQQHKWQQHSFKYVPASDHTMLDGLPHYTKIIEQRADVCSSCISSVEWPDENLYLTEHETPHIGTWAAHKNYQKPPGSNEHGWFSQEASFVPPKNPFFRRGIIE